MLRHAVHSMASKGIHLLGRLTSIDEFPRCSACNRIGVGDGSTHKRYDSFVFVGVSTACMVQQYFSRWLTFLSYLGSSNGILAIIGCICKFNLIVGQFFPLRTNASLVFLHIHDRHSCIVLQRDANGFHPLTIET